MQPHVSFNASHRKSVTIETKRKIAPRQLPQSDVAASAEGVNANFGPTEISPSDPLPSPGTSPHIVEAKVANEPTQDSPDECSFLNRALDGRNLRDDIAAADTRAKEVPNELRNRHAKLIASLEPAYPIFLHLRANKEAFGELLKHPHYADQTAARKRKPSPDKPALLAVQFVLRPKTNNDAKDASDYATLLEWAEDNKVAPCDFMEDLVDVSLRKAKQFVSGKRKRNKWEASKKNSLGASGAAEAATHDPDQADSASLTEMPGKSPPTLRITVTDGADATASADFTIGARVLDNLLRQLSARRGDQSFEDFVLALVNRLTDPKTAVGAESPAA